MIKVDFSINQKVSTHLAFIFILILSFLVAWVTLSKAQEIIENSKESSAFNIQKRAKVAAPEKTMPSPPVTQAK